ncbi:hypothetical protein DPMN_134088 [Dreissena polymorpha]|uniref:Uncharacterized protein n=1 Tax=Dreissena polymorpha TaxID=45954 RepID=A0A9D4FVJ2_DREPO|nr:hypothetical protein DPMN_134088 [Dreissena polymorpha]
MGLTILIKLCILLANDLGVKPSDSIYDCMEKLEMLLHKPLRLLLFFVNEGATVTVRHTDNGEDYLKGAISSIGQTMFPGFLLKQYHTVAIIIG